MLVAVPVISSSIEKKKNELFPQCSRTKQVAYPFSNLKTSQSVVDYDKLKRLQGFSNDPDDREETHQLFMKQFASVLKPPPKKSWPSRSNINRTKAIEPLATSVELQPLPTPVTRRSQQEITPLQRDIKILRRLLRKLHVQRTNAENDQIFQIMTQFPDFMALDSRPELLREAIELAHLEICEENQQPILPSNGFFFILKGNITLPSATSELPPLSSQLLTEPLTVGQGFGSLTPPEGRTKLSWLITMEENCEFLKINKDEFLTVKRKFEQTEYQDKYSLIRSCGEYRAWSKQTIDELLPLIEWIEYPQNTILASEGFRCPFIGYLKMGECHVLRKVDVVKLEQSGTKGRQLRQVVMGKIIAPDSFGEISVLLQEAMTCTIVTATHCWLGIIRPERLPELLDVTRKVILHTAQRTFDHLTQDNIRREYVNQETRKEWTDFKKDMVENIISKRKIRFGQNK